MNSNSFIDFFNNGDYFQCLNHINSISNSEDYISTYAKNIVYYKTGDYPKAFMISSVYKDIVGIHQNSFISIYNEILNLYPIPLEILNTINSNSNILKIGGGARWIDLTLETSNCSVTSMDSESTRLGFNLDPDLLNDFHNVGELPKNHFDWIVSSHVIEHLENPIKALMGSHMILKNGGYIYSVIPLHTQTFDKNRNLTTLSHLIYDYKNKKSGADWIHIEEFMRNYDCDSDLVFKGNRAKWMENYILKPERHTHYHVFDSALVFALHGYCGFKCINLTDLGNSIHYIGIKN